MDGYAKKDKPYFSFLFESMFFLNEKENKRKKQKKGVPSSNKNSDRQKKTGLRNTINPVLSAMQKIIINEYQKKARLFFSPPPQFPPFFYKKKKRSFFDNKKIKKNTTALPIPLHETQSS